MGKLRNVNKWWEHNFLIFGLLVGKFRSWSENMFCFPSVVEWVAKHKHKLAAPEGVRKSPPLCSSERKKGKKNIKLERSWKMILHSKVLQLWAFSLLLPFSRRQKFLPTFSRFSNFPCFSWALCCCFLRKQRAVDGKTFCRSSTRKKLERQKGFTFFPRV